jgi:ABC-type nitrate/sulfonate/bicarbonate transport system substrate-binding protein
MNKPNSFSHKNFFYCTAFFCFLTAIFVSESRAQKVQKPERVLVTTPFAGVFPIMMAKEKGFYRDDGLDADLILMRTDLTIKAVISGEAEFSTPFPTALERCKRVSDARGDGADAVSSPGATPDVSVRLILKKYGLIPGKDAKILSISGGSSLRLISKFRQQSSIHELLEERLWLTSALWKVITER